MEHEVSSYSLNKSTVEERGQNLSYIRMVYILTAFEMVLALIWTSFCLGYWDDLGKPIVHWWEFGLVAFIITVLLAFVAFLITAVRRFPINWIIYILFTLAYAHTWAFFSCWDPTRLVYFACWLFTAFTTGFAVYSFCATYYMLSLQGALVVLGTGAVVFMAFIALTQMSFFLLLLVFVACCVYGVYMSYNLRMTVRHSIFDSEQEDPVTGAVRIWVETELNFLRLGELVGNMFVNPRNA